MSVRVAGNKVFGVPLAEDKLNYITQVDNDTVLIRPRFNTTGLTELKIGLLLPFSQTGNNFTAQIVWGGSSAIRMAINDINSQRLIPGAYVTLIEKDSYPEMTTEQNAVTDAVYASVTLLQQGVIGVIGDVSSSWTSLSALMTSTLEIPQCSFAAGAVAFSDKSQYKYFFRTIPTQVIMADVMLSFAASQGWSKVGLIYTNDPLGQQFCQHAIIQANQLNMKIIRYQSFSLDDPDKDMVTTLRNVTSGSARVILVAASDGPQVALMVRAAELGLLTDKYVWLLTGDTTQLLQQTIQEYNKNASLPASDMIDFNSTYQGLFMFENWLAPYGYQPFEAFLDAWSQLDPAVYPLAGTRQVHNNEGLAYSCMMLMAQGFSHVVTGASNYTEALQDLALGNLGSQMTPLAFNVGYVGPQGPILFDSNGDLTTANYLIYNLQNGTDVVIGHSLNGDLQLLHKPHFHDGSSQPPDDTPPSIALNPTFSSPIARVIITVSSIGVLFSAAVFILVVMYRKHEIFKASSPLFCCLELIGFVITYVSVCLMIDIPTTTTCYAMPIFLNFGFLLVLGNMIAKNYRIYRIFNNIFITRTVITDLQLIKSTFIVVGVDMALLTIGLVVTRPVPTSYTESYLQHYWLCESTHGASTVFLVLNTIYGASMLLFATFLAYKTQGAGRRYSHYSETKQMGLSVYNILFSALVGFAVTVNPMADFYTKYYITVISILWATTFSLLILFLPKIHAFYRQKRKERKRQQTSASGINAVFRNMSHAVVRATGVNRSSTTPQTTDLISLDQMLGSMDRGPDIHTTTDPTNHRNYVEVHEGEIPVRRVFRYFPFLAQWQMQHIMVFPWLGYFSHISDRKEGAVMSYSHATVYTAAPNAYVLKIHGKGLYDMYIQLPDANSLTAWQSSFNSAAESYTKAASVTSPSNTTTITSNVAVTTHMQPLKQSPSYNESELSETHLLARPGCE